MNEKEKLKQQKEFKTILESLIGFLDKYPDDYIHLQMELSIVRDLVDKKIEYLEQK